MGILKALGWTVPAVATTAGVGSVATRETQSSWYQRLDKPPFQPPAIAFPIAWTALYATIAGSSAAVDARLTDEAREAEALGDDDGRRAAKRRRRGFRAALAGNLILNAGWCWTFFALRMLPTSTVVAGALAVSTADLARRAARESRPAGAWLVPYVAWTIFATVLTASIQRRNPGA